MFACSTTLLACHFNASSMAVAPRLGRARSQCYSRRWARCRCSPMGAGTCRPSCRPPPLYDVKPSEMLEVERPASSLDADFQASVAEVQARIAREPSNRNGEAIVDVLRILVVDDCMFRRA